MRRPDARARRTEEAGVTAIQYGAMAASIIAVVVAGMNSLHDILFSVIGSIGS